MGACFLEGPNVSVGSCTRLMMSPASIPQYSVGRTKKIKLQDRRDMTGGDHSDMFNVDTHTERQVGIPILLKSKHQVMVVAYRKVKD